MSRYCPCNYGIATPTEAAGVGAFRALLLAFFKKRLNKRVLHDVSGQTTATTAFIFAIFYLQGVAPEGIDIRTIYRGVIPFILLQLLGPALIFIWDPLATWLPAQAY